MRVKQMRQAQEGVTQWLSNMYEKYALAQGAFEDINTTIVIAEAHEAAAAVQETIEHIADISADIDLYIGDYESGRIPIRDGKDMIAQEMTFVGDAEFEKFLGGVQRD